MDSGFLFVIVAMFAIMYLLLIRPQRTQQRRHREMIEALKAGDEVITAGGMMGRIVRLDDTEARIEVAPGVEVRFLRLAVNARVGDDDPAGLPGEVADDPGTAESVDGGSR